MTYEDTFCSHCGIVLDLHPSKRQTEDQWECEAANQRADIVADFWRIAMKP